MATCPKPQSVSVMATCWNGSMMLRASCPIWDGLRIFHFHFPPQWKSLCEWSVEKSALHACERKNSLAERHVIVDWGRAICTMDKVKDKNLCYMEMATMASWNDDINGYLEWIAKTYGTQGSGSRRGRLRRPLTLPCAWKLFAGRLR